MNNKLNQETQEKIPLIITKAWLSDHFKRTFRWIRAHLLTDQVLTEELGFDLDAFRRWKDIPPEEGVKIKKWLKEKELI